MTAANIRNLLGHLIGQTVVDVTQHDVADWMDGGEPFVQVMMSGGDFVKFRTHEPFSYSKDGEELFIKLIEEEDDGLSERK